MAYCVRVARVLIDRNRLGPAGQPQPGVRRQITLDCDPATDIGAGSRPRFPPPGQRSSADAVIVITHVAGARNSKDGLRLAGTSEGQDWRVVK
jgi:hypothetical protein